MKTFFSHPAVGKPRPIDRRAIRPDRLRDEVDELHDLFRDEKIQRQADALRAAAEAANRAANDAPHPDEPPAA